MCASTKHCVFCGGIADTREHIFAKCFYDKPYPNNLLTMPSCHKCNNSFSLDEQYLMYLIDYLKGIECNNGDSVRKIALDTFNNSEGLENRMISSLTEEDEGKSIFNVEVKRIETVIRKIAQCLFMYYFERSLSPSQIECKWSFLPQLSDLQIAAIDQIRFTTIQEGLVKYYYLPQEVGFCLSDFFYASATIKENSVL